jgi:hypothetical protein
MKFRKKPIVITAIQFTQAMMNGLEPWPEGVVEAHGTGPGFDARPIIHTLEGDHHVTVNDWIIRGIAGELYPCKDSIFCQTYELVDDGPNAHVKTGSTTRLESIQSRLLQRVEGSSLPMDEMLAEVSLNVGDVAALLNIVKRARYFTNGVRNNNILLHLDPSDEAWAAWASLNDALNLLEEQA